MSVSYFNNYHIDVAIVEPTSRRTTSSAEPSATTKGAAAAYMERTKITTYANTAWPATVPFVLKSTCFVGNCATTLLDRITKDSPLLDLYRYSRLLDRSLGHLSCLTCCAPPSGLVDRVATVGSAPDACHSPNYNKWFAPLLDGPVS